MKRISLFILTLLLLLTSIPTGYAVQKGDDKGEVLNLPPLVDFEVKEKRKVDVIVDVGNTSKSIDDVNSWINQYVRPVLQADGLDYKIYVEKSSEGKTKQYYYVERYSRIGSTTIPAQLRYYDIVTQQDELVYENPSFLIMTGTNAPYKNYLQPTILEDEKHILGFSNNYILSVFEIPNEDKMDDYKVSPIVATNTDWNSTAVDDERWNTNRTIRYASNITADYLVTADRKLLVYNVSNINELTHRAYVPIEDVIEATKAAEWNPPNWTYMGARALVNYEYFVKDYNPPHYTRLYSTHDNGLYRERDTSFVYYNNYKDWVDNQSPTRSIPKYDSDTYNLSVHPSGDAIFMGPYEDDHPISKYSRETGTVTTMPKYKSANPFPMFMLKDGRVLFYVNFNSDRSTDKLARGWYLLENFEERPKALGETISSHESALTNHTTILGGLGSKVFFRNDENSMLIFDVDTTETSIVRAERPLHLIKYPDHLTGEIRYMKDIIKESTLRADAEKYYVRIDDSAIMQLQYERNIAELATEMNSQQITYLALGSEKNQDQHTKLLNTIDNRGRFIANTDMKAALQQVGGMMTNKKEADLHVLIANESIPLSTIKDGLKQVQTELQAENIVSSINYIQGTSTSKVFDLISQINWRTDRNNYVVMFNRGSMSELNNVEYEVEVATELSGQYASYIAIGTTANKTVNDRLIATNKSGGVFTSSTTMSAIKTVITKHVKDTAVKNPKRVTDTLVLNYDQETGEYSSDLLINTFYEDAENDPKFNERFKTTHDPTVYENHTGVMEGIGQYQPSPTTKFTKVGKYEMVVQVQDNPSTNAAFANYLEWSLDSLSRLVLFVHRAPIADFTATVNTSGRLTIVDLSYDLDRYSERNKGIVTATWRWKKADDADWTAGSPPTTLAVNTDYLISLKVKDRDGAWSNEVVKFVTTKDSNQPPVALFTVSPKTSSWSKTFSLTDQSYDPDGDTITKREWIVSKEGKQLLTKGITPTATEIKNAAVREGLSQLGSYQIQLRVQDRLGLWSTWHQDYAYVVNHAPIAQFERLTTTYRDTMNTVLNLTANPDQDGDAVTYRWRLMKGEKTHSLGTTKDVSFRIRDRGLGKDAVGTWSLELRAADPLGAESFVTHSFQVLNQIPTAEIISYPVYGYVDEPYNFAANSDDPDTEDKSSLQYFWKLITPSGKVIPYYEKNLSNLTFNEKGKHSMEHWVMDQLGAESKVDKIEFTILNKLPIADFTRTPITTYRNTNIDFKSLGTDPDGWIEAYRYELLRDGQSPLTISTNADFTRAFSSIGTFDIRHTVTDNDGASASITKKIYIVNRAPKAEVTQPSGTTAATATEFNTLTPTIRWTMTDADHDPQVQYQLQLKNANGTVLRTTAPTATANNYYTIPIGWITEGPVYRVAIRVYDGYDWSEYSADKYFYIMLNRPPTAGFTYTPSLIYEGDQLSIKHAVNDLDLDTLSVRYTITAPNGQKSYYPSSTSYYNVSSSQYGGDAFSIANLMPGNYIIEQSVTDSKSEPVKLSRTLRVGKLGIVGNVAHTELWEDYRNSYNASLPAGSSKEWLPLQFYSGERFMLTADTTLADRPESGSTTYAVKVTALLQTTGTHVELSYDKDLQWSGSMWEETFSTLTRGKHTFTFNVHYSNGVVKQHAVEIEIIGKASELVGVHRWK